MVVQPLECVQSNCPLIQRYNVVHHTRAYYHCLPISGTSLISIGTLKISTAFVVRPVALGNLLFVSSGFMKELFAAFNSLIWNKLGSPTSHLYGLYYP